MFNISNGEETLVTTDSESQTADFSDSSAVNAKQLCNTTVTADEAPCSETVFVVSVGRVDGAFDNSRAKHFSLELRRSPELPEGNKSMSFNREKLPD